MTATVAPRPTHVNYLASTAGIEGSKLQFVHVLYTICMRETILQCIMTCHGCVSSQEQYFSLQ